MKRPKGVQIIGQEIAILWQDGEEDYFPMAFLREFSPSAENIGEMDILGNVHGGTGPQKYPGVTVQSWGFMGNYAIRFDFSDGHDTGLYSYDYLIGLREHLKDWSVEE
ncbi:MAG: hypothetical protein CMI18_05000 [Opitutaceae bacterium]|nr:hypothetical protein [Opitutaceae bacterium]|tara:strand:- start:3125 stop:3448 length:324 start_codon:yes stop_codon:yes gene_type:complete